MTPAKIRANTLYERGVALLLAVLPLTWAVRLGGVLGARHGRAAIAADRAWVRRLRRNLQRWRGPMDPAELDR